MWDDIIQFFTATPLWELALIFSSRIIEVSLGTLRIILINKGYRKLGAILAFIEVSLWIFIASRVITGITEAPLKAIIYSLGFASGVYVGSRIEGKLAFGKVLIQAIVSLEHSVGIASTLRADGLGVTIIEAQGKDAKKMVLMIYANRKGKEIIINKIKSIDDHAMVITNDVSTLQGGYITSWRRFVK